MKKSFDNLEPGQKKKVIWSVIGIVLFAMILAGYNMRSKRVLHSERQQTVRDVELEPDLIEKTMLREQRRELDAMRAEIDEIKKDREMTGGKEEGLPKVKTVEEIVQSTPQTVIPAEKAATRWPLPMAESGGAEPTLAVPPALIAAAEPTMIGEIGILENPEAATVEDDKKKGRTVYLPPSFMQASLLTGFDASTSGKGKGNPEPMLLRIQTPAVLPNDIKGDVEGCFVVAEAVGRLDKERADVRLVSLSCLSKNGEAVIDEPVKGFVTDSDSKVGLAGRVVSRMGAATARATVAGLFGGAGDWLKAAATTTSTSALGSTQTVESGDIVPYALGGGLSEGADTLRDFYLDLARQTTPVIEVGATKKITVVISEGIDLTIREIDSGTI